MGASAIPAQAWALGPVEVEIAGEVGAATGPAGSIAPVGLELGGRAGASFFNIYAGVAVLHWFGGTAIQSCVGPVFPVCTPATSTAFVTTTSRSTRYGFEVGFDVHVSPRVTLRPLLGIGDVSLHESSPEQIVVGQTLVPLDGTANELYLEPGVTMTMAFGLLFLGADASVVWLPRNDNVSPAVAAHAQIGVRF